MTFSEIADEWIKTKKMFIKESTFELYHYEIQKYLNPMLGSVFIKDLSSEIINKIIVRWKTVNEPSRKRLKTSTICNLITLIKQIVSYGAKNGSISELEINKNIYKEEKIIFTKDLDFPKVLQKEDIKKLVSKLTENKTNKNFGIYLALTTGMRIGEVCALRWEDFDFNSGILHINKTLQRIACKTESTKTKIQITSPKSKSSIRRIPLSKRLLSYLLVIKPENPMGYILTNSESIVEPRSLRRHYKRICDTYSIHGLKFHALRHTFATECIDKGADYKTVSEILGHANIKTTLNLYVHPSLESKQKVIDSVFF